MPPRDVWARIPRCPTKKLRAKTNEDKGRTGKEGQGQDGQTRTRAGWTRTGFGPDGQDRLIARTVHGQDRQGTKMGWMEKAGRQLVRVNPGLDTQTKTVQCSLRLSYPDTLDYKWHSLGKQNILPANLDYKQVCFQDSPGTKAN